MFSNSVCRQGGAAQLDPTSNGAEALAHARALLRQYFGYSDFRPGQADLVSSVLQGADCVGVMPTGAGKSVCYQLPALALAYGHEYEGAGGPSDGGSFAAPSGNQGIAEFTPANALTLVISPLVSLMSDQVMALRQMGILAAYLNSRLTPAQQGEVLSRARAGAYAIMYVAPERLDDPRFLRFCGVAADAAGGLYGGADEWASWDLIPEEAVLALQPAIRIPLVAVDEAHCVSQWGQDFRPSYLGIADFIEKLPERPVVAAFTATATPRVSDDIVRLLRLRSPLRVTTGFDRPNLKFGVEQLSDKKKLARIEAFTLADLNASGIVYCSTRKDVERVHEALVDAGVRATRYHAGLAHGEREANQRAFVNDDAPVMVATNAFGMGIDKSNVRYVTHYNMPGSLEAYYQEAGRAGRDGEPSECLLLWNDSDIATCRFFIEQESGNEALSPEDQQRVRASQRRRLAAMTNYCMTTDCLRATILRYFGEDGAQAGANLGQAGGRPACGNCSNCTGEVDAVDVTKTARSVMRCVHELRGRFGKGIVTDVLCGSKSAKIREYGLDAKRTYGIVEDSTATVKEIIELLTAGEYLEISEGRYPLVGLGPRAREAATDEFRLYMKRHRKAAAARPAAGAAGAFGGAGGSGGGKAKAAASLETEEQKDLFERLRQLRKRLADAEGVPPYIVFSDAALRSMCVQLPASEDEFLAVPGVGPAKLKRYGAEFLAEIARAAAGTGQAHCRSGATSV